MFYMFFYHACSLIEAFFDSSNKILTISGDGAFGVMNLDSYINAIKLIFTGNAYQIPRNIFKNLTDLKFIDFGEIETLCEDVFNIPSVTKINLGNKIRTIHKNSLPPNLEELHIPESVIYIDTQTVNSLHKLTEIHVNTSNNFYSICNGSLFNKNLTELIFVPKTITSFYLPRTVTTIGGICSFPFIKELKNTKNIRTVNAGAFDDGKLESINLPTCETISDYAFRNCLFLTSLSAPNLKSLSLSAFIGCTKFLSFDIPSSVTTIHSDRNSQSLDCRFIISKNNRFYKMVENFLIRNVDAVVISRVTYGDHELKVPEPVARFNGAGDDFKEIEMPSTLIEIGSSAFIEMKNLRSVDLHKCNKLTTIKDYAFYNCEDLELILPKSVKYLGIHSVTGIKSLEIETGGNLVMKNGLIISTDGTELFTNYNKISEIPITVEKIHSLAFCDADSEDLEVELPNLEEISDSAFFGSKFKSLTIGERVTVIPHTAFMNAEIDELTFDGELDLISKYAFAECNINHITFHNVNKRITVDDYSFTNSTFEDFLIDMMLIAPTAFKGAVVKNELTINLYIAPTCGFSSCNYLNMTDMVELVEYNVVNITENVAMPRVKYLDGEFVLSKISLESIEIGDEAPIKIVDDCIVSEDESILFICQNQDFIIPKGVKKIYDHAFHLWEKEGPLEITIPGRVEETGTDIFDESLQITSLILEEGVRKVDGIGGTPYVLKKLSIPSTLETFNFSKFNMAPDGIIETKKEGHFVFIDNVLYKDNKAAVFGSLSAEKIKLIDTCNEIGENSFSNHQNLTIIEGIEKVTSIGERAFDGCNNLLEAKLSANSNIIGNRAFADTSLRVNIILENDNLVVGSEAFPPTVGAIFYRGTNNMTDPFLNVGRVYVCRHYPFTRLFGQFPNRITCDAPGDKHSEISTWEGVAISAISIFAVAIIAGVIYSIFIVTRRRKQMNSKNNENEPMTI